MAEKHSIDGVFSRADVIRIRREIVNTPTEVFANEFKVSLQCIRDLVSGRTHADCNDEAPPLKTTGKHLKASRMKERALKMMGQGIKNADIARELNVSQSYITLIAKGQR